MFQGIFNSGLLNLNVPYAAVNKSNTPINTNTNTNTTTTSTGTVIPNELQGTWEVRGNILIIKENKIIIFSKNEAENRFDELEIIVDGKKRKIPEIERFTSVTTPVDGKQQILKFYRARLITQDSKNIIKLEYFNESGEQIHMTYISLTDNYDNLKIGTDISINEFLRTNFRKPDDSGNNYLVDIGNKKSDNYDEYPEYVPSNDSLDGVYLPGDTTDGNYAPAQTKPVQTLTVNDPEDVVLPTEISNNNNIPQELIGSYLFESPEKSILVAISENEMTACNSNFDDIHNVIIDGNEHSFDGQKYSASIITLGTETGSLKHIIENKIMRENKTTYHYAALHNDSDKLKMTSGDGFDISLEEFLDADETSNNVNFFSKISDTPDLSLCPEVIEPPTKPVQTLTVNDPERNNTTTRSLNSVGETNLAPFKPPTKPVQTLTVNDPERNNTTTRSLNSVGETNLAPFKPPTKPVQTLTVNDPERNNTPISMDISDLPQTKPEQTLTFNDTDHIPISMDILDLRPEPTKPKQMLSMELPTIPEKFTGSWKINNVDVKSEFVQFNDNFVKRLESAAYDFIISNSKITFCKNGGALQEFDLNILNPNFSVTIKEDKITIINDKGFEHIFEISGNTLHYIQDSGFVVTYSYNRSLDQITCEPLSKPLSEDEKNLPLPLSPNIEVTIPNVDPPDIKVMIPEVIMDGSEPPPKEVENNLFSSNIKDIKITPPKEIEPFTETSISTSAPTTSSPNKDSNNLCNRNTILNVIIFLLVILLIYLLIKPRKPDYSLGGLNRSGNTLVLYPVD